MVSRRWLRDARVKNAKMLMVVCLLALAGRPEATWAQSVSGVRAFGGGVAPLFNLAGPGNLYVDMQGTMGWMYTPGNNFESYNFRNPSTGQAWSGALMTLGPQLSVGLIQGANQIGTPTLLVPPPRSLPPLPDVESTLLDIP